MSQNNESPLDDTSNWEAILLGAGPTDVEAAAEAEDSSDPEDLAEQGLTLSAKKMVLSTSKSIVSLVSYFDGKIIFACTGTVVDHVGSASWILTSATLVRIPDSAYDSYDRDDIKIEVHLHNKRVIDGCLAMCDLQYNIAVVTVESQVDIPIVALNDLPGYYSTVVRPVIVLGRDFRSRLLLRQGVMIRERSKLDCSELLVCTCPVSKIFIGGLVMDFARRIVGISFFCKGTTPVLPVEIVARCLQHFKYFGKVKQPCFYMRGHALHSLELRKLDQIYHQYPELSCGTGIVVEQIPEVLSPNCGGIEVGDIICSIDGVVLHSMAQLTAILLDVMVPASISQNTVSLKAGIRRPRDNTEFVAVLNVLENRSVLHNRWTLP